jgi:hypothetical protein
MLGEIALWSFVVLLVTGVFLTLWYAPSMAEVTYEGSYEPLRGVTMSRAYASTLGISFDVRGGLLLRQMHHWAALIFIAAMFIHMIRSSPPGAFRKPREVTWMIGGTMLLLGIVEGFAGYSLPDDLLSGTGLRTADGIVRATPVVGTYLSFFLFGGEFPGDAVTSRLYIVHVLLIPGRLVALILAHLILIVYHKHTQWPGPGPHGGQRRRVALPARVRGEGHWVHLRRLRRDRADGRAAVDQPGLEVRAVQPSAGVGRIAAGLVPRLRRRRAKAHARMGERILRPHDPMERRAACTGAPGDLGGRLPGLAVLGGVGVGRQA